MPRVTRAALRSKELQVDADIAASTPLPQTPTKNRIPLGEVAGNRGTYIQAPLPGEQAAQAKKGTRKGKKGNNAKTFNKQNREEAEDVHVEVLEDESQSIDSSAAKEACQDLLNNDLQGMVPGTLAFDCTVTNLYQGL